jgi:hypothetical protein
MNNEHLHTKIYKRCDSCCLKCRQCREFEKVIEQIDLEERSQLERQRLMSIEINKDKRNA